MKYLNRYMYIIAFLSFMACSKSGFLDKKPNEALIIPTSLDDMEALMDNDEVMNGANVGLVPVITEEGADNYYVKDESYVTLPTLDKNIYKWADKLYSGETLLDWNLPYKAVFYSNLVLGTLEKATPSLADKSRWERLKGAALFHRAHMFFWLAQVFAAPYRSGSTDPGIPLRLTADVNEKIQRAGMEETYRRIVDDLMLARTLLPDVPLYKTRPGRCAAYAMLARVEQMMGNHSLALKWSDSAIILQPKLIDFNTLNTTTTLPFQRFNDEVVFHATLVSYNQLLLRSTRATIDSNLYSSYEINDLRKVIFFGYFRTAPSSRELTMG